MGENRCAGILLRIKLFFLHQVLTLDIGSDRFPAVNLIKVMGIDDHDSNRALVACYILDIMQSKEPHNL